jgi:hypothetical protein
MLYRWVLIERRNDRIKFMGIGRLTEQRGNQLDRAGIPFDDSNVAIWLPTKFGKGR